MVRATVEVEDERFNLVRQQIDPGPTVVWQSVGTTSRVVHSIQFCDTADESQFRTQTLRSGDGVVYPFDEEGIYEHHCGLQGRTRTECLSRTTCRSRNYYPVVLKEEDGTCSPEIPIAGASLDA